MFIGHFAPALLAATRKDAPSLPVLFVAAQLVDWAFFGLLIAGVEKARITPGHVGNCSTLISIICPIPTACWAARSWAVVFGIA